MKNKQNFQWKRTFGTTAFIIFSIIFLDIIRRSIIGDFSGQIVEIRNFDNMGISDSSISSNIANVPDSSNFSDLNTDISYSSEITQISLSPVEWLGKGSLSVINSQHTSKNYYMGLCNLALDKNHNEFYSVNSSEMLISDEVIPNLNQMMTDYNTATGKNNLVIYNTTELQTYPESVSGYSFDLSVLSSSGEIIEYDGLDSEGWITENCHNYGFILRYPEDKVAQTGFEYSACHFRYVGLPHSLIMNEMDMCLEEYTEFLKSYSYENPFTYTVDGLQYAVYYTASTLPSTSVKVPSSEYEISGNNYDGYIISYCKQ